MTELYQEIIAELSAPLNQWLREHGAEPCVALAPPTREGAGDLALPCHRYARSFRKAPQAIAQDLLPIAKAQALIASAEAQGGFLNLRFAWPVLAERILDWALDDEGALGRSKALKGQRILIEYSSPNTNKPQHLGHCRNNILGNTVARLMSAAGADVQQVNLINDRGIHICKSMVAYQRFAEGSSPESSGKKGDHLIGEFYVKFEAAFSEEYKRYRASCEAEPLSRELWFNSDESEWGRAAREMLLAWEAEDEEVRGLWKMLNGWCEGGFFETYARMGVAFDRIDRESETYLLGKDLVAEGLESGVFHRAENGAVVFDLERLGLKGEKAVLRADGTSVYMTQDLGTALRRYEETHFDKMIYVVGNEQDYHFCLLFGILAELRPELKERLHHLSYGMVELPDGQMKSRQGKVVDADDLMDELASAARKKTLEENPNLEAQELAYRAEAIGLAGLKFFLLKFAPTTTFIFNPAESIKAKGETGVYCQYAYARGGRILEKLGDAAEGVTPDYHALEQPQALEVLRAMLLFPQEIRQAAEQRRPSLLAQSTFNLAQSFAAFYNHKENQVLRAEGGVQAARARLVRAAQRMLGAGLELMGITALRAM